MRLCENVRKKSESNKWKKLFMGDNNFFIDGRAKAKIEKLITNLDFGHLKPSAAKYILIRKLCMH